MSMNMGANNYTYPRKPASLSTGNITVNVPPEVVEKNYDQFLLYDNFVDWKTIPAKIKTVQYGTVGNYLNLDCIMIPAVPTGLNAADAFEYFKRRLILNNDAAQNGITDGHKRHIPIVRPVGKKAYLHSISWAAYDFNTFRPFILNELSGYTIDGAPIQLTYPNEFGDLTGMIICVAPPVNPLQSWWEKYTNFTYSTADYAIPMLDADNAYLASRHTLIPNLTGQTGLRSQFINGLLASDLLPSNFKLDVGLHDGTGMVDDMANLDQVPQATLFSTNLESAENNQSRSDIHHVQIPQVINDMDILIPDTYNWLITDVEGMGWFIQICDEDEVPSAVNPACFYTPVFMPMAVSITIRYAD